MNEHKAIKRIHRRLPKVIRAWKIHDTFAGGVPDALYSGVAGSLWVEYKHTILPKNSNTIVKPKLSKQQLLWFKDPRNTPLKKAVIVTFLTSPTCNADLRILYLDSLDDIEIGLPCRDVIKRGWNVDQFYDKLLAICCP